MRTRPEAQHEALARRLALLRAEVPEDAPAEAPADGWLGAASPFVADESEEADWWSAHTGVPEEDDETPGPAGPVGAPVPTSLPVPGRHAARRRPAFAVRLPEALRGRVRLGPAQLSVVALAVAAALALTCWYLARGRATTLAPPAPASATVSEAASPLVTLATPAAALPSASPVAISSGTASAGAMVTVDVEGKVRRPGIVILPMGSRVTDALEAAGGVPHRRSLGGLNLAAVLVDGQQITVGAKAAVSTGAGGAAGAVGASGAASADAPVNLNTATAEQLDTLPGVGPVTAQSILDWREQNGGFTSVQELLEVDGIGAATLAKIAPHATV